MSETELEARADALIAQMTPEEKAGQLVHPSYVPGPLGDAIDAAIAREARAAAQVRGLQGGRIGERLVACIKHFAGYGAAGAGSVMNAYMALNGVPAAANAWLLTEVLRRTWGFEGLVISDADTVKNLATQGLAHEAAERTAVLLRNEGDLLPLEKDARIGHETGVLLPPRTFPSPCQPGRTRAGLREFRSRAAPGRGTPGSCRCSVRNASRTRRRARACACPSTSPTRARSRPTKSRSCTSTSATARPVVRRAR